MFVLCTSLTDVKIPDSVTKICSFAFLNCNDLVSITIPDSVTSIEYKAFSGCESLERAAIPETVTEIGNNVFENCPVLTIYGKSGSYAETYANNNNIPFVAVTAFGTTGDCAWMLNNGVLTISGNGAMEDYIVQYGPVYMPPEDDDEIIPSTRKTLTLLRRSLKTE